MSLRAIALCWVALLMAFRKFMNSKFGGVEQGRHRL